MNRTISGDFHYGHVFSDFHVLITAEYYSFLRGEAVWENIFIIIIIIIYLFINFLQKTV